MTFNKSPYFISTRSLKRIDDWFVVFMSNTSSLVTLGLMSIIWRHFPLWCDSSWNNAGYCRDKWSTRCCVMLRAIGNIFHPHLPVKKLYNSVIMIDNWSIKTGRRNILSEQHSLLLSRISFWLKLHGSFCVLPRYSINHVHTYMVKRWSRSVYISRAGCKFCPVTIKKYLF